MRKKPILIGLCIVALILIASMIYVQAGSKKAEALMWQYLSEKGDAATDVQRLTVNQSFLNVILSYNEWTIRVEYQDEPDVYYHYTLKDGVIVESGRGGVAGEDSFKH